MNVKSTPAASALWTDQVSSTVSALEKSSDATVSSFSKMLDQMMGEGQKEQSAVANAASGSTPAAKAKMKHFEAIASSGNGSATAALKSAASADAKTVAQTASDQWMNKMSDRFTQTVESGANSTLLSQDQLMAI